MSRAGNRRIAFGYLFTLFLLTAVGETLVSTLFPLIREDLGLTTADQAVLTAALTLMIGVGNLTGGWVGSTRTDRLAVRLAAGFLAVGAGLSAGGSGLVSMVVAQALMGFGVGLFFGPGLASIGRMYAEARGRAIASYGLAYSLGLAAAAFAANVGVSGWRIPYLVVSILAAGLLFVAPGLGEAPRESVGSPVASARSYWRLPLYRTALGVGVVAGTVHYVLVGLTPELFVARGVALALVAGVIGAGRLLSMVGKYFAGWAFDRWGGIRTAQIIMTAVLVFGALEMLLPGRWGLVPILPFVSFTSMLFPVSNAMVVSSLPPRASWGVGIYRATLMLASAVCAGVMSVVLRWFEPRVVMIAGLAIPAVGIAMLSRRNEPRPALAGAS